MKRIVPSSGGKREYSHCVLSYLGCLWIALICLCGVGQTSNAQIDSALGFYPLNVGDMHQFVFGYTICGSSPPPTYHLERVIGDTVLSNGHRYRIVLSNMPGEPSIQFLRVDSASANVYRYVSLPSPGEELIDSLRATLGSYFIRGDFPWAPTFCTAVDTMTLLGISTVVKRFLLPLVPHADYSLAYGLGRVQIISRADDPCYPLLVHYVRSLVYAKIAGIEYGMFVGVDDETRTLPGQIHLGQNYPNPFNPSTTIEYQLPAQLHVTLKVYDVLGREVTTLVNAIEEPGFKSVRWDARGVASGVYFYRLEAGSFVQSRKLMLMK